ncbi:MAG: oxygen-independent coproporphyrinogen III oxidase [Salaquimonas sp.]|jgi:oxygen-independent coproporphyrinogen-3 oxidase|nr:oxygen-independent coproporphyrinogen III oxidase [Salaquimonas sp.]
MTIHARPDQTIDRSDPVRLFAAPVPRYTSYPTAPHFHDGVDAAAYRGWLGEIGADSPVSVYVHVPFCDRLCWFCGCHTKQTLRYDPVGRYLEMLHREVELVAAAAGKRLNVHELHLGGGSPSMLKADDLASLGDKLRKHFDFADDARISVEIDPNDVTAKTIQGFKALGMNRASIGVQDFDRQVQETINRIQTFEDTKRVVEMLRDVGISSINVDALYGLPHQSQGSLEKTIAQVISLEPDRIALFGYAHVPWMKTHQRMIDEASLPDIGERYAQARLAEERLKEAGYVAIGIDHFARPGDSLAQAEQQGRLRRNFQGYTDDPCEVLIGLGASSIGRLPQGYVQNITATGNYMAAVAKGELPVAKGVELTDDDRLRARVIEMLMCEFGFSSARLREEFGEAAEAVIMEAEARAASDAHGFFRSEGDRFVIAEEGRPFARTMASWFDAYLGKGKARHSSGV